MIIQAVLANLAINVSTTQANAALAAFQQRVNGVNFHRLETALHKFGTVVDHVAATAFSTLALSIETAFSALERSLSKYQGFIATMRVSTGSVEEAAAQYTVLRKIAQDLGLEVSTLTSNYAKLLASVPDVTDKFKIAEDTFLGVATAARAVHASGEDTRLMFYAVTQMASKGTLSMEELRRQLAEKLPGAWQIAARAVGRTTTELEEEIRKGTVNSVKFLRFFGPELFKTFEEGAKVAATSFDASIGRLKSLWMDFTKAVVDTGAATEMSRAVDALTTKLSDPKIIAVFTEAVIKLAQAFRKLIESITPEDIDQFIKSFQEGLNALIPFLQGFADVLKSLIENMKLFVSLWAAIQTAKAGAAIGGAIGGPKGAIGGGVLGFAVGGAGTYAAIEKAQETEADKVRKIHNTFGGRQLATGRIGGAAVASPMDIPIKEYEWYDAYAAAMGISISLQMGEFRKALQKANTSILLDIIKRTDFTSEKGRVAGAKELEAYILKGVVPKVDITHPGKDKGKDKKGAEYDIGRTEQASRDFLLDLSRAAYGKGRKTRETYDYFKDRLNELRGEAKLLEEQSQEYMTELLRGVEQAEVQYAQGLMGKMREEIAQFGQDKFSDVMEEISRQYTERTEKVMKLGESELAANRAAYEELIKTRDVLIEVAQNYARLQVVTQRLGEVEGFTRGMFQANLAIEQIQAKMSGFGFESWATQKDMILEFANQLEVLRDRWLEAAEAAEKYGDPELAMRIRVQAQQMTAEILELTYTADEALNQLRDITREAFTGLFDSLIIKHESFSDAMVNMMRRMAERILQIYIDMLAQMIVAQLSAGAAGGILGSIVRAIFPGATAPTPSGGTPGVGTPGIYVGPGTAQYGADWSVSGSGGIDSQMVRFMATPGERVLVFTNRQQKLLQRWLASMGQRPGQSSLFHGILNVAAQQQPGFAAGGEIGFMGLPQQSMANHASAGPNVVVNVYNSAEGVNTTVEQKRNAQGQVELDVMVDAIEGKMGQRIGKGRGLAPVLERTYGLGRSSTTQLLR